MPSLNRKAVDPATRAFNDIAKRLKIHLRLAREMRLDGYLRIIPELPDCSLSDQRYSLDGIKLFNIAGYYGVSSKKIFAIHNKGFIDLNGLDYKTEISRYMQRHEGKLSVRLLCYLVHDKVRPEGGVVKDQKAHDCLSALHIDGKLNPPRDLRPYLDAACRGQPEALERVARWMRYLIGSINKPHGWAFFGLRLALVEGSYNLRGRPVPKLRKLRKFRKLASLLRNHPMLHGCVTAVSKPGGNRNYSYMFHRPGEFWDL